ncbi:hypothetical protein HanRHA438_Chr14g0658021 [Helianthus annuus]|nr:hypothetical protein HanRHA438_Chr14g0658021 [Helianthus annuus]
MKTIRRSIGFWEIVDQDFSATNTDQERLKKNTKEGARALALIEQAIVQQCVHPH